MNPESIHLNLPDGRAPGGRVRGVGRRFNQQRSREVKTMSFKTIDLRPAAEHSTDPRFQMAFVARDYVPGHAFVIWTKYKDTLIPTEEYAFGLYPEELTKKLLYGDVPGKIDTEPRKSVIAASDGLIVRVTETMYDYALTNTLAMRTGPVDYSLLKESCVDFVRLVATSLALDTPTSSGLNNHPQNFIADLKSRND
jgi:hypothetical protein